MRKIILFFVSVLFFTQYTIAGNQQITCANDYYHHWRDDHGGPVINGKKATYLFYLIIAEKISKKKDQKNTYQVFHPDLDDSCREVFTIFVDDKGIISGMMAGKNEVAISMMYLDGIPDGVWHLVPYYPSGGE